MQWLLLLLIGINRSRLGFVSNQELAAYSNSLTAGACSSSSLTEACQQGCHGSWQSLLAVPGPDRGVDLPEIGAACCFRQ